jgi:hypothetical protein
LISNYYAVAASNLPNVVILKKKTIQKTRKEAMVAKTGVPALFLILFLLHRILT